MVDTKLDDTTVEYTSEQNTNYQLILTIARRLLREKYGFLIDELIPILRDNNDCRSYQILAADLIPQEYSINPMVAKKIIHLAVQEAVEIHNADSDPSEFIDLKERTSRVRIATNHARSSGHVMIESMGRQAYSMEEIVFVVSLMQNCDYQWPSGAHKGYPNWNVIADALNEEFGTSRRAEDIAAQIKTMRYIKDKRLIEAIRIVSEELGSEPPES